MKNRNFHSSIMAISEELGIDPNKVKVTNNPEIGDSSANIAFIYARKVNISPQQAAKEIIHNFRDYFPEGSEVKSEGSGYLNEYKPREFFTNKIKEIIEKGEDWGKNKMLAGKKVMVEYTQPNPFKPFHIGHLMSNAIGESISRIVEFSGANIIRANYQGDVGMHVAKAMYGMYKAGSPVNESAPALELAGYIGDCYVKGSDAYDNDPEAKKEIEAFNKKIYDRSDEQVNQTYDWGRKVTLEAFEEIYKILGTKFDHYFFESDMAPIGEKIVRENARPEGVSPEAGRGIFEFSDGAIVFKAEEYDPKLHTRVFITSAGIPLYEAKEIGLTMTKFEKEDPDLSIVTTAIEQGEYMKVVQKAISLMHPDLEKKMKHITHGMMRLASGKMSSRKGNVVTGESLLRDSMDVVREKVAERELSRDEKEEIAKVVGVAALKYSILRSSLGSDIIYDFEKSISFEGDSGPYLQYTAVRANSILEKAKDQNLNSDDIPKEVTTLEKILYRFPEIVERAYIDLEPHHIATYLTECASAFNSFYGNTHILTDDNNFKGYHVALVQAFHTTMQNGLWLLGIQTPEKM